MSIKLVEEEVRRFLSTPEPEVVCISGHWGVGKTFAWNRYLKDAQAQGRIALKHYAYVSLFGVNSLDELKYSIFENSIKSSDIGIEPNLETLRSNTSAAAERIVRKSIGIIQQTPFLKNYVGGLAPMWFSAVRETVICVDDIERRGKELSVRDVLGLINNLKEHRGCKMCLILNDEALEEDEEEFRKYLDKVVDTSLKFTPSPDECVRIALATDTTTQKLLADACVKLGLSNIRLIKRIERSVYRIDTMLKDFDEQVLRQAVHSLALLGWSVYEPSRAPSIEFLQKRRGLAHFALGSDKAVPENEAAWNAMLDAYGFSNMDDFDQILLDGVRNGFFDPQAVEKSASQLDKQVKAAKLDTSFWTAWGLFHDSFDDNQEDVLDAVYESFVKGVQYINPMNLSATVILFKRLGRPKQASQDVQLRLSRATDS